MKKAIIATIVISSVLFAQMGITAFGGLSLSNIKYNDSDTQDLMEPMMKIGLALGAEKLVGPVIVGAGFQQMGSKYDIEMFGESFEGSTTINYLAFHVIYPYSFMDGASAFGGLKLGYGLGGTGEMDGEEESIKSDDLNFEYGLFLGADYYFADNMGVRASYYLGLSDVVKDVDDEFNFKGRGIGISFLYKL